MRHFQLAYTTLLASLVALALPGTLPAATATYKVTINTSPLIGHPAGPFYLLFALTDGSGLSDGNNSVTISRINFSDGRALDNPSSLGGVTGTLSSTVIMTDTSTLNYFSEAFSAGEWLRFMVTVTANVDDGPIPDGFTFYILDNSGHPIPTLSPGGDYLASLAVGLVGATPTIYGGDPTRTPVTGNPITLAPPRIKLEQTPEPRLVIDKKHSGKFALGQKNASYQITVANTEETGPTSGTVTVTENPPPGLALVSMAGDGWTCTAISCSRNDILRSGAAYPEITVVVNVASSATSPQVNTVTVSGGGSHAASASDSTIILPHRSGEE